MSQQDFQQEEEMRARQRDPRRAMVGEIAERHRQSVATEFAPDAEQSEAAERHAQVSLHAERAFIDESDTEKTRAFDARLAQVDEALDHDEERQRQAADVRDAIDMMFDGEVDEAAKLLAETMAAVQGRSATPSTDEVVSAAVGRIKLEQQLASFQKEYTDVANDKYLGPMVDREFMDLVPKDANGEALPLPPEEFGQKLRQAGDRVRNWARAKGNVSSAAAETESASDASAVIAEIARARGQ